VLNDLFVLLDHCSVKNEVINLNHWPVSLFRNQFVTKLVHF
jgi:hypothetical protein